MGIRVLVTGLTLLGASAILASFLGQWLGSPPPRPRQLGLEEPMAGAGAAGNPSARPAVTRTGHAEEEIAAPDRDAPDPEVPSGDDPGRQAPPGPTPFDRDCTNLLLIGLDPRVKTRSLGRPDTLLLLSLPGDSRELGLTSIPRDLYLEIPGHGFDRINAVFGAAHRNGDDPLQLARRVVAGALGVRVERTLVVDLRLFERAVDLLGGVTVEVPCPIQDNFVDPRTSSGRRLLEVEAGQQEMDGVTAGMYVRSRHGRSDFSRARRQQAMLMAMRRGFLTAGGLARLPRLWSEVESNIVTDMPRIEIFALATRLAAIPADRMHGIVLGDRHTRSWRSPEGRSVLLPDDRAIRRALAGLFAAPPPGLRPGGSPCPPAEAALVKNWGH